MLKVQLREGMIQQNFLRRSIAMLSMRTFFIQSCALESHLLGQGRPSSNGCGAGTAGHCRRRLKQFPLFRGSLPMDTRHSGWTLKQEMLFSYEDRRRGCGLQRFLWKRTHRTVWPTYTHALMRPHACANETNRDGFLCVKS